MYRIVKDKSGSSGLVHSVHDEVRQDEVRQKIEALGQFIELGESLFQQEPLARCLNPAVTFIP